jgi:hypothetical protein
LSFLHYYKLSIKVIAVCVYSLNKIESLLLFFNWKHYFGDWFLK